MSRVSHRILGWGGEGIKCLSKHVTRALMTFGTFLSRKVIELHLNLNLHTTVSINTVKFVYSLYDIHCIHNYNDYIILNFKILEGWDLAGGGDITGPPPVYETLMSLWRSKCEKLLLKESHNMDVDHP